MSPACRRLRVSIDSPVVAEALARLPARTISPFVMDCILRALRDPDVRRAWGHYLDEVPPSRPPKAGEDSVAGASAGVPSRAGSDEPDLSFLGPLAVNVSV